jgi:hypothetical protein
MNERPDAVCSIPFPNPPKRCRESLRLLRNGSIEAVINDFSEFAHGCYGSEITFILTLDPQSVCQLMEKIRPENYSPNFDGVSDFDLHRVAQRFGCYMSFKGFCDFNKIPYSLVFVSNTSEAKHVRNI